MTFILHALAYIAFGASLYCLWVSGETSRLRKTLDENDFAGSVSAMDRIIRFSYTAYYLLLLNYLLNLIAKIIGD